MKVAKTKFYDTQGKSDLHMQFHKHASIPFTYLLLRLNATANQTTVLSCLLGLLGGFVLFTELRFFSILFFYLYFVLDYSDGWIARYTGTISVFGGRLDNAGHLIVTTNLLFVTMMLTKLYLLSFLVFFLYFFGAFKSFSDIAIPKKFYEKIIHPIHPQLVIELTLFFSVVLDNLQLVLFIHLLIYMVIFLLYVIKKIRVRNDGRKEKV